MLLSYVSDSRQNWTYVDCYSDLVPGRALPNGLANSAQTVEGCLEACSAKNYAYCGVEYHGGEFPISTARFRIRSVDRTLEQNAGAPTRSTRLRSLSEPALAASLAPVTRSSTAAASEARPAPLLLSTDLTTLSVFCLS